MTEKLRALLTQPTTYAAIIIAGSQILRLNFDDTETQNYANGITMVVCVALAMYDERKAK